MKIVRLAAAALLVLGTIAATDVAPSKAELEAMYDRAFRAFDAGKYDDALKELDAIDARKSDLAESQNLRGVILMRQGVYDKAEAALSEAQRLDSKFWNARFNLAEIPFLKKDWPGARKRFQELLASNAAELQGEATQLIQYKVLLTYLMEGNDAMVDSILAKFELSTDTPAVHYANTAISLQHQKIDDARNWMSTAEKNFSPQLNKLFAESLFEIGWLQRQPGQQRAALQLLTPEERVVKKTAAVQTKFEEAQQAFEQRNFDNAATLAEAADTAEPNKAATLNLRGEIALEQQKYDEAENYFNRALKADKNFREAQFNLADLPFRKKDYAKARTRFEALLKQTPGGDKNQATQLIKFRIFMTHLLEGKDSRAQKAMEQFQFSGDTPALYYAQAAWEFQHGNKDKANDWIGSARKIYPSPANTAYGSSFYDLGWLKSTAANTSPAPGAAAVASSGNDSASPAIEPSPIPGAEAKANEAAASLNLAQAKPVEGMEAMNSAPKITIGNVPPSPETVVANATPAPSVPATPENVPAKAASESSTPAVETAKTAPIVASTAPVNPNPPAAAPSIVAQPSSSPPAVAQASTTPVTVLAPAQVREQNPPSLGDKLDRFTGPKPLLFIIFGGGGIALLTWLLLSRARGSFADPVRPLVPRESSVPLTSNGEGARLSGGPRRVSLQLKPSEPSLRRGAMPLVKRAPVEAAPPLEPAVVANGQAEMANAEVAGPAVGEVIEQPAAVSDVANMEVPSEFAPPMPSVLSEPLIEKSAIFESGIQEVAAAAEPEITALRAAEVEDIPAPVEAFMPDLEPPPQRPAAESEVGQFEAPPAAAAVTEAPAEPLLQGQPIPFQTIVSSSNDLSEPEPMVEVPSEIEPAPIFAEQPAPEPEIVAEPVAEESIPRAWTAAALLSSLASATHSAAINEPSPMPTEEFHPQPTNTEPMSETQTPSAPVIRTPAPQPTIATPAPTGGTQAQPGGMHTAVQITLSCEIASMQLTPTFKMGALQLRPISKVVTMRLAPSQQQQGSPMNLQVNFEVARVQPGSGTLGQMRLNPSQQQKPPTLGTPSFNISGLQLMANQEAAPVQLTPQQQGQASVHVTAAFQITTVEFSQSFDIASIILNSTGRTVLVQLPGAGAGAIETAPAFEIANVQLGPNGEIALMQLTPAGARRA